MYSYKGLCFSRSDLVIEVSRFEDKTIYYFVVVRYGIRGYSVLFTTQDLYEAFALYDEILKENGDKA